MVDAEVTLGDRESAGLLAENSLMQSTCPEVVLRGVEAWVPFWYILAGNQGT